MKTMTDSMLRRWHVGQRVEMPGEYEIWRGRIDSFEISTHKAWVEWDRFPGYQWGPYPLEKLSPEMIPVAVE